jgi:hypothetical protein
VQSPCQHDSHMSASDPDHTVTPIRRIFVTTFNAHGRTPWNGPKGQLDTQSRRKRQQRHVRRQVNSNGVAELPERSFSCLSFGRSPPSSSLQSCPDCRACFPSSVANSSAAPLLASRLRRRLGRRPFCPIRMLEKAELVTGIHTAPRQRSCSSRA